MTKGGLETHPTRGIGSFMFRIAALFLLLTALPLRAEEALVAVAANFFKPAEVLAEAYEVESGHKITLASGSTGQHYAQIIHGAPYDLFLSADEERPALLTEAGLAEAVTTYAVGRLAYFAPVSDQERHWTNALMDADLIAIANPDLAPYGRAARDVLENLGIWDETRTVQGQNVGQAFAMIASGNVKGGLVAASQVRGREASLVPSELHAPIRQDAVLLTRAKGNLAAAGFLAYLASEPTLAVIESFGYDRPDTSE